MLIFFLTCDVLAGFGYQDNSVASLPKMHNLNSITRISDISKLRTTPQKNWSVLFRSVAVMKEKGSLKKWAIIKATKLT